jgi:predicted  nucleic acid-binding Zn-ribbon protein
MKRYLPFFFVIPLLIACEPKATEETTDEGGNQEVEALKAEVTDLKMTVQQKDSVINESFRVFNEIENNLALIKEKEEYILINTNADIEFQEDQRVRVLEDMQYIHELLESNKNKISSLSKRLKRAGVKVAEYEKLVARLMQTIDSKDMEIDKLNSKLADLDSEYGELFDAYLEKSEEKDEVVEKLNTAYFAFGTFKELKENKVLTKEGGLIGIGRTTQLQDDFNHDYFTEIDITETKSLPISGKKVKLITTHPQESYQWEKNEDGETTSLTITDPELFWSVSKYFVAEI